MNLYLEFQNQILGLLYSNPFETVQETIHTPDGGLFTNKVLTLEGLEDFNNSLIGQTSRILGTAIENLVISHATTLLLFGLSNEIAGLDPFLSFSILFHDRPIVRDRRKLLQIESLLRSTIHTTGKRGKTMSTIKDSEKINALIQTYIDKKLLSPDSHIPDNIKYSKIFIELSRLNTVMKFFLAAKDTEDLDAMTTLLIFHPERIEQLDQDYACTRLTFGFKCNADLGNSWKNIKHLRTNTKQT
ncbi:MAG: hypothetical protein Q4B28_00165 [bacterium]|nr:hypothetical protein [bacterium]